MFSFLKLFNSKPNDTEKNENNNSSLNGRKLNLRSLEEANTHNNGQPVAFIPSRINTAFGVKRRGDFSVNISHPQKKAKTRNNEILSSYSSSKFLLKPSRKRSYQTGNDDELHDHKHSKSCFCRGSTVLPENDQNILNRSIETTKNDLSDDFVTVAAGRIFNRSGKTQVIKKISMKTIFDEILDDVDLTPFTSIEKVEEKKKKSQNEGISLGQHTYKSDIKNIHSTSHSADLRASVPSTETGISSVVSSATSVQKALINTTPSESIPQINKENINSSPLQFDFDYPKVSAITSTESSNKQISININTDQTDEPTNRPLSFQIPKSTVQFSNEQHKLQFQSLEKNKKNTSDESQARGQSDFKNDIDKLSFHLTTRESKSSEFVVSASVVDSSDSGETELPAIQFGCEKSSKDLSSSFTFENQVKNSSNPSTFTLNTPKPSENHSTPLKQFDALITENQQSLSNIKFEKPKVNDKLEIPVLHFGFSEVDGVKSTPVKQFGELKVDGKQSIPLMQFGASLTEPKNVGLRLNSKQNFGQTVAPECDATIDKSTLKLPFVALPAPVFGIPNTYQSKHFAKQTIDNQGPKLVFDFGNQVTANKPAISAPGVLFTNNTENPGFQLSNYIGNLNDKVSGMHGNSLPFSTEAASSFGTSGVNTTFRLSSSKAEESKTPFSTPVFGSQNTTTAAFKFGDKDKHASFGCPLPSSNHPAEPLTFGSTVSSCSAFQFGVNKAENGPVEFGQISNTFPAPEFSGFGNPAPRQFLTFGNVPLPQTSQFTNKPTFGIVTSLPSNTFETDQGFQTALSLQFGSTLSALPTTQLEGTQSMGANQPLFSLGTAPAGERRIAKATRRRQ